MDLATLFVLVAAAATVAALAAGISSMPAGEIAHHKSGEWMIARVGLQAATILLLLLFWIAQQ